jgi:hypothetical protein
MSGGEIVPSPEPTAQTVTADVIDALSPDGVMLPPKWVGQIARNAKAMLARGIPADVVRAASYIAVRRRHPAIAQDIAGDLMLARGGQIMDRTTYETSLARVNAEASPTMLDAHRARTEARENEIRQLRGEA